jgi:hypothetical protein
MAAAWLSEFELVMATFYYPICRRLGFISHCLAGVTLEMHLAACGRTTHHAHRSTAKSEKNVVKKLKYAAFDVNLAVKGRVEIRD